MNSNKCCDNCIYYHWYYDFCELWNVKVDARSICNSYKNNLTKIKNYAIIIVE